MSNGKVIEGKYEGREVDSNEKGAFIYTYYRHLINIDKTTAISANFVYRVPGKSVPVLSTSEKKFNWVIRVLLVVVFVLISPEFFLPLGAPLYLIIHILAPAPEIVAVAIYHVEITWKDGEKSLIECDSEAYNKIQGAFYQE